MAGQDAAEATTPTASVAIDPTIVRAQAAKAAPNDPAEQERLFQQFMEWSRAQQKQVEPVPAAAGSCGEV